MSDEDELKKFAPKDLPKCVCFDIDNDVNFVMSRCECITEIARKIAAHTIGQAKKAELCDVAMPYLVDILVLQLAVHLAIGGTILEPGSEDAERETERVLTGIEARLMMRMHEGYEQARRIGLDVIREHASRMNGGETLQ